MATASEVKSGMDSIAQRIASQRARVAALKTELADVNAILAAIPTDFSDVIATIDGYAAGSTDYFERTAKDEKAKLAAEFTALNTAVTTAQGAL